LLRTPQTPAPTIAINGFPTAFAYKVRSRGTGAAGAAQRVNLIWIKQPGAIRHLTVAIFYVNHGVPHGE
jgi:hypothetical protein